MPAGVGPALRLRDAGSPLAPDITAVLDWSRDEGAPRTDEHYHVLRGTEPDALTRILAWEPLAATSVTDSTVSVHAGGLDALHFYRVVAVDACEQESSD